MILALIIKLKSKLCNQVTTMTCICPFCNELAKSKIENLDEVEYEE